ncbi:hypothetical protein ACWNYQ_00750 [Candidatus Vidania fulgoroideorum]
MSRKSSIPIFLKKILLYSLKNLFIKGLLISKINFEYKDFYFFRNKNLLNIFPFFKNNYKNLGTHYSILKNFVNDNLIFYSRLIILNGIEFKVKQKKGLLIFDLGYSHKIKIKINKNILINISKDNKKLKVSSNNRELLGNFCNKIIKLKKFNLYKDKGLRYLNDKKIKKNRKKK